MVKASPWTVSLWLPTIREWCAHVTVTPDLNKINVFKNGTSKALNLRTPKGGHTVPSSTAGVSLLWKKDQKKDRKKNTSETINNAIPQRSPNSVIAEWSPWKVASLATSFHHWNLTNNKLKIERETPKNPPP